MKFILIHGAYGSAKENWFPWLQNHLIQEGHEVMIPTFPTPDNQTLSNWEQVFEKYLDELDEDTVLIGHSLGPSFILRILEQSPTSIRGCIFVAGFSQLLDLEIDEINCTFVDREFNWTQIKQNCPEFIVLNSNNDPYVSTTHGKHLANMLGTQMIEIPNAGHFNIASGFDTFPELLKYTTLLTHQKSVQIEYHGEVLEGIHNTSLIPSQKSIVLAHGFGVTRADTGVFFDLAYELIQKGYHVFRYDFEGSGRSTGDYATITLTKLQEQLNLIVQSVKQQYTTVHVLGQSLGTCTTIAANLDVESLMLLSGPLDPKNSLIGYFGDAYNPTGVSEKLRSSGKITRLQPEFWTDFDKYDMLELVKTNKTPKCFVIGSADEKISVADTQHYFDSADCEKEMHIVEGADHPYTHHRKELIEIVSHWLSNY